MSHPSPWWVNLRKIIEFWVEKMFSHWSTLIHDKF
jgi:hypothetical protein